MRLFNRKIYREEDYDKVLDMVKELVEKSQQEEGCIEYDYFFDVENKFGICIYEEWEEGDYLTKHQQTEHFKRLVPKLGELAIEHSPLYLFKK